MVEGFDPRARGFNCMPLKADSKKPDTGATWKEYQTEQCRLQIPGNYAVICGGTSGNLVVIDIDNPDLYPRFSKYHGKTFTVKSGRDGGGYHMYFRTDREAKYFDVFDADGNKCEVKGVGRYVVGPGSIHAKTGRKYEIVHDVDPIRISAEEFMEFVTAAGFESKRERRSVSIHRGVGKGERNDACFVLACREIREYGLTGNALLMVLQRWNEMNDPPMPDFELEATVKSAEETEQRRAKTLRLDDINSLKEKIERLVPGERVDMLQFTDAYSSLPPDMISKWVAEHTDGEQYYGERASLSDVRAEARSTVPRDYRGMVIGRGKIRTYDRSAEFACKVCGDTVTMECDKDYKISTPKCPGDPKHGKMDCNADTRQVGYIRRIIIQQLMEDATDGKQAEYEAEIMDQEARDIGIGDRREFTMVFRSMMAKDGFNDVLFQVMSSRRLVEDEKKMPTEEELAAWRADPDFYSDMMKCVAPDLLMQTEVVESTMFAVATGASIKGKRRYIHIGLVGDAGVGKSDLVQRLEKICEGSKYSVGTQASRVGLAGGLQDVEGGTKIPRLGLLALYNKNVLYLDEVDKMNEDDKNAVLSSMEQGITTIDKGGHNIRAAAETTVIAIGNPKYMKYDTDKMITENINMSAALLSRFDVLWVLVDKRDADMDRAINDLLNDETTKPKYDDDAVKRYVNFVRSRPDPKVTKETRDMLYVTYQALRSKDMKTPIGIRQLLGLYRMAAASARLHLRDETRMEDVETVKRVVHAAYDTIGGDPLIDIGKKNEIEVEKAWKAVQDEEGSVDEDEIKDQLDRQGSEGRIFNQFKHRMGYHKIGGRWIRR